MEIIEADIIDLAKRGEIDVLIHGCNCFCTMGRGLAKSIKEEFPSAYEEDCKTTKGEIEKLGTYSKVQITNESSSFYIINAYTQFNWRGKGIKADYNAIRKIFKHIKEEFSGKIIAYPLIGAGLANGNWEVISKIIDEELKDEEHILVKYKGNK